MDIDIRIEIDIFTFYVYVCTYKGIAGKTSSASAPSSSISAVTSANAMLDALNPMNAPSKEVVFLIYSQLPPPGQPSKDSSARPGLAWSGQAKPDQARPGQPAQAWSSKARPSLDDCLSIC